MSKQNFKLILIGCFFFTLPYWIKPVYEFVHEKAVDIGLGTGDKVALYVDSTVISDTFKKKDALDISTYDAGNAYRGSIIRVYPVYLRYKKSGIYFITYPEKNKNLPNIKTYIDANNITRVDYYFRDEIQFSLAGSLGS